MPYSTHSGRRFGGATRGRHTNNFGGNRRSTKSKKFTGQYIDPRRFVKAAKPVAEVEEYVATNNFSDFAVNELIHANLTAKGYVTPSPIQDQTIPEALNGKDIIGIANTGTGKTAAFGIPVLDRLIRNPKASALVVAPTRELAQQIDDEFRSIAKGSGLSAALLIGGSSMGIQLRDLRAKPQIIIGTPGRIKDHLERGSLNLATCNTVVLDEVDRMLDMGFVNDVTFILAQTNEIRQSYFFSATMDERVSKLINAFGSSPITISVKTGDTSDNVDQDVVHFTAREDKIEQLHDVLTKGEVSKAIIFDETQRSVERLSKELIDRGFKADAIHGGKTQGQRQRALNRFKKNEVTILVATDVAARGIDVADISHVINYSVPQSYEDYVHRIGRAGRAGKTGYALTFVSR